tara:strand:- start:7328 stop:7531 length:204 start_codon:yes stop_codon:yes gene_type:complete
MDLRGFFMFGGFVSSAHILDQCHNDNAQNGDSYTDPKYFYQPHPAPLSSFLGSDILFVYGFVHFVSP